MSVKNGDHGRFEELENKQENTTKQDTEIQTKDTIIGVSVIIPTYNESENINSVVTQCLKALPPSSFDVEIIVVDDDSDDYTWQYPTRLFGHDPRVRVIRRQTADKGLARSVADGFEAASHEYCAVIDADLQHPPDKLSELFTALDDGADIAIGSRHIDDGGIENWPLWRKVVSKGATLCARVALPSGREVSDPMSGFFAVRRSVTQNVELDPQGYKILLEILGKGAYDTVTEVPYVFQERERGESKLTADEYQNFLEHLGQLSVVDRGLDSVVAPQRAVRGSEFAFVGAVGTIVNMAVFGLLTTGLDLFFLAAGVVAFVAAVNWNFAGNWLLTYDRPDGNILEQYTRFHVVSVVGFLVYSATLTIGAVAGIPLLVANLVAIIAGSGVNFFGSETSVFQQTETRHSTTASEPNTVRSPVEQSSD